MASLYAAFTCLVGKPDEPNQCWAFGLNHLQCRDSVVKLLTNVGFVECTLSEESVHELKQNGCIASHFVREQHLKALIVPCLWQDMEQRRPFQENLLYLLQYTMHVIHKVNVGHIFQSVQILKDLCEKYCTESPFCCEIQKFLHSKEEWKQFVLNCWVDQASLEIENRHPVFWQNALKSSWDLLNEMIYDLANSTREVVIETIKKAYYRESQSFSGSFCEPKQPECSFMTQKQEYTYTAEHYLYECIKPLATSSQFVQAKCNFYSAVMGYQVPVQALPRNIDMTRALACGQPPPHTHAVKLWNFFNVPPPLVKGTMVAINYDRPGFNGREFGVFSPFALNQFLKENDLSAGEILQADMWVTAITFDVDGKTVDAFSHSAETVYSSDLVLQELVSATREVMLEHSHNRWDMFKHKPAVHLWRACGTNKKLSMRISIHLPQNLAFHSISTLQSFVHVLIQHIKRVKYKYLCTRHVLVDSEHRFEMSILGENGWYANINGSIVKLEHYIQSNTKMKKQVIIQCLGTSYTVSSMSTCGYNIQNDQNKTTSLVFHLFSWICCTMKKNAMVETFLDEGIYCNNHSVRLPLQSKLCQGEKVRKFVAHTPQSLPIDALVHYPHGDTPPITGEPLLIKDCVQRQKTCHSLVNNTEHFDADMAAVKEFIFKKYNNTVVKITPGTAKNLLYLDLKNPHLCVIKGGVHSQAKMFLVYDQNTRQLLASCWSSNCRQKLKQSCSNKGMLLLNLSAL